VLQRAAEAGDPRAALTLAGTYDPIVLEKLAVHGFAPNIAMAREWYEKARQFGSAEAPRRLEMLATFFQP
jgi:TPR repeat protein